MVEVLGLQGLRFGVSRVGAQGFGQAMLLYFGVCISQWGLEGARTYQTPSRAPSRILGYCFLCLLPRH